MPHDALTGALDAKAEASISASLGTHTPQEEREVFIDNPLVRVHWIFEMIVAERLCAMGI